MNKKYGYYTCFILCLPLLLAVSGCSSGEDSELSQYIYDVKSKKAKPIEPIPEFVSIEKFIYPDNEKRRSPFKKKTVIKAEDQQAPNTKRPKQPLEMFPLDALKFVGLLKQDSMVWALISQPDGSIVKIRVGEYMGQNFGKVISITEKALKLEETLQVSGKWEKKVTIINLGTQ